MARYCVDASFALAAFLPGDNDSARQRWLAFSSHDELVAPPLLLAECASILHEHAYRHRVSRELAEQSLEVLLELPVRYVFTPATYRRAFEIAGQLGWAKAYDAVYIAVAELERGELLTLDSGMHQGATRLSLPTTLVS